MIHSLTAFLAPEHSCAQATMTSPPALPATRKKGEGRVSFRFMAGVAANAAGFGLLLAGGWFSLHVIQLLLGC